MPISLLIHILEGFRTMVALVTQFQREGLTLITERHSLQYVIDDTFAPRTNLLRIFIMYTHISVVTL